MKLLSSESMPVRSSEDVVIVRQAVRKKAVALGFGLVDQTKFVTAASELARNTLDYGGGGDGADRNHRKQHEIRLAARSLRTKGPASPISISP